MVCVAVAAPAEDDAVVEGAAVGGDDEDGRAGDEGVQAQQGAGVGAVVVLGLGEHGDRAGHPAGSRVSYHVHVGML